VAIVHLIHGYLGVGKTTFAKRLERELPAIRFTHDEWMVRLYGDDPPQEMYADYFKRVYDLIGALWLRCVALGNDVVLDFGFWSRAERDRMRAAVAAAGAECTLYDVRCPEAEAWARIERRNAEPGPRLFIARNTFDVLKARFEPLEDDEARITVDRAR
jgi:predicted kinase